MAKTRKSSRKATRRGTAEKAPRKNAAPAGLRKAPRKPALKHPARKAARKPKLEAVRRGQARRKNPGEVEAAARLSEQFHGRPARTTREVAELENSRDTLTDLGRLVSLLVWTDEDTPMQLDFQGVRLAASPDGGQLYLIGAQRLDIAALGLNDQMPKDHLQVGVVESIVYQTSKAFHNFEPCEYQHEFGEEGGHQPALNYDVLNEKFFLTGGTYQVRPEGIVN